MEAAPFLEAALVAARLLLATVFGVAGLAKLADRAGSRQALIDFGLPAALAGMLGLLLPLAELVVAILLLPTATAWVGAVGALGLLLLFIAGISLNLARGRRPDCRCFGQLHSAPAGPSTLARNAALATVAAFLAWQGQLDPGPSLVGWLGGLTVAERVNLLVGVAGLALLGGLTWLVVQVLGQQGRVLLRLDALEARLATGGPAPSPNGIGAEAVEGLPIGSPAPGFSLPGLYGEILTLDGLRATGKPTVLLFMDPGCGPCTALLPELGRWQRDHASRLTLVPISRGTPEANRAKTAEHGVTPVLLQRDYEVGEAFRVYGTPSAVLVHPDGTIGTPVAAGVEAIRSLVAHAVQDPAARPWRPPTPIPLANNGVGHDHGHDHGHAQHQAPPPALRVGDPAPPLKLPDLDGKMVDLAEFRGGRTLVLFWNPGCGFCQQMLGDLKAWETQPPDGGPKLLVVSTGPMEQNRAMGLRAPVVLDQGFSTGQAFGANGTPTAVLVDAEGRIASDVAAGAPAVLALARASGGSRDGATA